MSELEGIAIIGMSGRFPGAESVGEFWANLVAGRESITRFSDDQLRASGVHEAEIADPLYVRSRGVLEFPECFDAEFFGWTAREAEVADPQQRLFLQCVWEAFEDAGCDPRNGPRSVGVFAGASLNTYFLSRVLGTQERMEEFVRGFQSEGYAALIGNDKDYLATRVAHQFDFRGPAMTIQTACSTSMVAIAQACQALNTFQCDLAVAGGVSVTFPQERGYFYQEGSIGSSDGHCRAFDARAGGTVFGSGCGVVLLRRLSEAVASKDPIHAVIRSVALNNDGSEKASYMAPSSEGQAEVIALAHALAGVEPDSISYVEAHGTGTPIGDPIEVAGLTKAFRSGSSRTRFCGLGSVKTNVGHLESAAGVVGLIKTAMALKHRFIPATLHFQSPHPDLEIEASPFYVVGRSRDWKEVPLPRRAGVSSFGVGGTNAHAVLEEAPDPLRHDFAPLRREVLLPLAALDATALEASAKRLADWIASAPNRDRDAGLLHRVAYTLQTGRSRFPVRRVVVAVDADEAVTKLRSVAATAAQVPTLDPGQAGRGVVFMFPGQGAQYPQMGCEAYGTESVFREAIDRCLDHLERVQPGGWREALFPPKEQEGAASISMTRTVLAQPLLFANSYALSKLWMSWGIQPSALVGHSVGEFVAAVIAGSLAIEDALELVVERARLMQSMRPGAMVAVRAAEKELQGMLGPDLSLAAINGPRACVVSGPIPAVEKLEAVLGTTSLAWKRLGTSHAFHSPMMREAADGLVAAVRRRVISRSTIPVASTLTGGMLEPSAWTTPEYWREQILKPVQFESATRALAAEGYRIFLEVGPGRSLTTAARQTLAGTPVCITHCLPSDRTTSSTRSLAQAAGDAWLHGVELDWRAFQGGEDLPRESLPTYPFKKTKYWASPKPKGSSSRDLPGPAADLEGLMLEQLQTMSDQLARLGAPAARVGPEGAHPPRA